MEAPRKYCSPEERNRATHRIEDLLDRLRLVRTSGIGPVTYRRLIARFGTPGAALAAVPDLARRGGGAPPRLFSQDDAERELARVQIIRLSGAPSGAVQMALLELDLAGRLDRCAGGKVSLRAA